ncbi:MAG: Gx transporter family protein [Lachnospiraceae bacterium]|jgi:heptaprenyl diphosphate synthase|nr:Gx transporter family protein [Lachnospiraceae bacterium]
MLGVKSTKNIGITSLFLALALVLSYIETLLPVFIPIPGLKIGLPNLVIIIILYLYDLKTASLINVMRIFIAGFMFGSAFSIVYSLAGAFLSMIIMALMKKTRKFSIVTVSSAGGIFHNLGQIIMAAIVMENYYIFTYFPVLFIGGLITGIVIGIIARELLPRLRKIIGFEIKESE